MFGKVLLALALAFLIHAACYWILFPRLLRRRRGWPRRLFGRCSALAWWVSWLTALVVFWSDFAPPGENDAMLWHWGWPGAIVLVAVIGAVVQVLHFRSPDLEELRAGRPGLDDRKS